MSSSARKAARDAFFGRRLQRRSVRIDALNPTGADVPPDHRPVWVEIREPTKADRGRILSASGVVGQDGRTSSVDIHALQREAVLRCCFVAETGEPLFDAADVAALDELPGGDQLFDALADAALKLLNVDVDSAKKN